MSVKDYIYLPGGNPSGTFTEAAETIMRRAMPYMGKYNELYRRNSKPYQSVARGLSEELQVPVRTDNLFFSHGVKEAMKFSSLLIDALSRSLQEKIRAAGHPVPKFKLLIRTPSYKHVVSQFQRYRSFECQFVSSFEETDLRGNGSFSHLNFLDNVSDNLRNLGKDFEYIIGYLDINPCNPTGHVRGRAENTDIAGALFLLRTINMNYLKKVLGKQSFKREHFFIIEDHIYKGLEYGDAKTVSICQESKSFQDITHTVLGVAKYGLVGMRGSVTVAPAFDARLLHQMFDDQNSDISPFSVLSCEYMFGDNPDDKRIREKYLKKKSAEYERNTLIATSIIDGKARDFLSSAEYEVASAWLIKYGKLPEVEAHKLLEEGIAGVDVVNVPRSGFFLLLNYDKMIRFADDEKNYLSENIIKFIREVAHHQFSMHIGDSEYMGLDDTSDAVMRFTVATSPAELIKRLLRLKKLGDFMNSIDPLNTDRIPDPRDPVFTRTTKSLTGYAQGKPFRLHLENS